MRFLRPGGLVVAAAVLAALGLPGIARGDAVTQWSINASSAIFAAGPTAHASTLSFAMVQGAVYDAVNATDGGYLAIPTAGLYGGVMRSLSVRFGLTTAENARLFAMVSLAAADGAIGCWNDKYYWNFWRPIDAIRLAATDGNPATEADPSWRALFDPATVTTPPLATPNFPDHPSGHSCLSSAALNTMRAFFGTDKVGFDVVSSRFPGTPAQTRHFDRFSHALKEVIDARVWGGIHFRTADTQGAVIGKKVAHWQRKHYFRPVG